MPATGEDSSGRPGGRAHLRALSHRGFVDHLDRLWVATACGVFRNDRPSVSDRFRRIDQPASLDHGAWAFAEDKQGTMWITNPDGLWRLSEGRWRQYRKADGLLSDQPYIPAIAPDGALWLRHRFDAGIERVEFSGDRIVRSTAVVPADAASRSRSRPFTDLTRRGASGEAAPNGVSVLAGGSWRHLSTEDGLIWNDTDGEAFWADADGSVWIGTSGGLAHYRPPGGGLLGRPVADPVITGLEIDQKSRVVRAEFSSLSYKNEQLVHFAYRLDGERWTDTTERIDLLCRPCPGPASAGDPVAGSRWTGVAESGRGGIPDRAEVVGNLVVAVGRSAACRRCRVGRHSVEEPVVAARNRQLEVAVRQRTAELESERTKVLEEKRRADAASEAKGRFLATMSHEIRTPLNGVIGLSRLLEAMQVPPEALEMIRMIRSSGDALLRVINDVLDFSKVEAGKLELDVAPFISAVPSKKAYGCFAPRPRKRVCASVATWRRNCPLGSRGRNPVAASGAEPDLERR